MKTTNRKRSWLHPSFNVVILLLAWVGSASIGLADKTYNAIFNARNAARLKTAWSNTMVFGRAVGDFTWNLLYYQGKTGGVFFDVDPDTTDGSVILRQLGDLRMVPMGYRVENRWLVNGEKLPSGYVLSSIRTAALEAGFDVAHIVWKGRKLMPYHVEPLRLNRKPDDVVLHGGERWTQTHPSEERGYDPLAHNADIIHR